MWFLSSEQKKNKKEIKEWKKKKKVKDPNTNDGEISVLSGSSCGTEQQSVATYDVCVWCLNALVLYLFASLVI